MNHTKTRFDEIAFQYEKVTDSLESVYSKIRTLVTPHIQDKEVLDIGNGGYFPYDISLARKVTVLDISEEMLARIQDHRVHKIIGDARNLEVIPDESADVILFFLSIHHMNGRSTKETNAILKQILVASRRKLKPKGKLIIAEPTLGIVLFSLQKLFFSLIHFVLETKKVGMIYFYHPYLLRKRMARAFNTDRLSIQRHYLPIQGYMDPLGGSFPGFIKIPGWLCPTKYFLFIAEK